MNEIDGEPVDETPCGNCDGRGTVDEDRFRPGRVGHFTVASPCPECRPDAVAPRRRGRR